MASPYIPSNPTKIDQAFILINEALKLCLIDPIPWLDLAYGDVRQQEKEYRDEQLKSFIHPIAYDGLENGDYDTTTPDSNTIGQVFHYVLNPINSQNLEVDSNQQYIVNFASIYTVNLAKIYTGEKRGTIQNLAQQVLECNLQESIKPSGCLIDDIRPTSWVYNNMPDIWSPFTSWKLYPKIFLYPNSCFRVEYRMILNYESC